MWDGITAYELVSSHLPYFLKGKEDGGAQIFDRITQGRWDTGFTRTQHQYKYLN